ncbi:MAG: hypothetical protein JO185_25595 [Acidobacteriaceae bacterium]|nr:hypothetical protein [Acidobacteriaceae bacterium]MBV9679736.1 hypothetical protein [Acidobacteriaceae bacterium]
MISLAALLLPLLLWDKGPETVDQLYRAHIQQIAIPSSHAEQWKTAHGVEVVAVDVHQLTAVPQPTLTFNAQVSSATRAPWVNQNGWRFLRQPGGSYLYETKGEGAVLAAAESFAYGVRAYIRTDEVGIQSLGRMLAFLSGIKDQDMSPEVNIGFVDDGSPESGEFMNLLVRRNLLFKVVQGPDPKLDLNVALGQADYPRAEAANPKLLAEKVRAHLTDEKRLLRIYGSEVVIGRLLGNESAARLFLLNYGAAKSPVHGLRIRVLGSYPKIHAVQYGDAPCRLTDILTESGATEFTLPELATFATIDLGH